MVVCEVSPGWRGLQLLTHHRVGHVDQGKPLAHVISDESYERDVIHIFTGSIDDGFNWMTSLLWFRSEIFGKRSRRNRKRRKESAGGEPLGVLQT